MRDWWGNDVKVGFTYTFLRDGDIVPLSGYLKMVLWQNRQLLLNRYLIF
ncbi:hypothetical protein SAMN05428949_4810 [Chitinophaga sp. YR627]|nr:hypothetical protein SAMN05428949_4810 [Chitinophaga sp. YR627]